MQKTLLVLLVCAVAAHGATQRGGFEPCYPPGPGCANFGAPVPLAVAPVATAAVGGVGGAVMRTANGGSVGVGVSAGGSQVVLQSNAIDVETDGGFVISLPSPPPPTADLPEFSEDRSASSIVNKVIAHGRNKIRLIEAKLAEKKKALSDHETWLEQAKRALERVKKQMQETRLSAKAIRSALTDLESKRKDELKRTRQARLAKELAETQSKLSVLAEQQSRVKSARHAIERRRQRISRTILDHGRALQWHNDQLKSKIQQFEDEENDLAQIGQTPYTISHADGLLEDSEERRDADV